MPQQQDLFEVGEPTWVERLRESLEANTRRQTLAVLAEMMRVAVQSPTPTQPGVPSDED